ncbi:DUF2252 domain-containing protein [Leifsonia poae]|uniref:DUF2252 domain-containing protein n=1 Tax=Leifsonia poae TaxID=110933 RepID=UPI003D673A3F
MKWVEEREFIGHEARKSTPRSLGAVWEPPDDRADPVALIEEQNRTRVPELVPIRHGRMMVSPFTFYRGAALIMAADLARTPSSGLISQLCGDAHLSNFGVFGTPERSLIFDLNDFDETSPGPWEWDLKRLATSFEVAGRNAGLSPADRREATVTVARAYRQKLRKLAKDTVLGAWYDRLDADAVVARVRAERANRRAGARQVERGDELIAKARTRDNLQAFKKLVSTVDGELRIIADPPLIEPIEDLMPDPAATGAMLDGIRALIADYRWTLPFERHPLDEFELVHMARKVVGVGSVGTRAWILLFRGRDDDDPLLLQVKEAEASVLERYTAPSQYKNHGERVVRGQRTMQAASDIFLGWQRAEGVDGVARDFYLRQLRDWKGSVDTESIKPAGARIYAELCGETLARAHSRSGDRIAVSAYLGGSDRMDESIADFAVAYADQNERDYAAFIEAIASGRLEAIPGL